MSQTTGCCPLYALDRPIKRDPYSKHIIPHIGAAERSPDNCAKDIEAARALNVDATRSLATLTKDRSIFLIYISTDYVFSGKAGEAPYECDDKPSPTNEYGQTKLDGEQAVLDVVGDSGQAICLRVPVLYGSVEEGKNSESAINTLIDTLWKAQKQSDPISMDDYSQRYPTNTTDVGKVCLQIAEKYLAVPEGSQERGKNLPQILHFSSEDRMTKYEICEKFSDWMGLSMENIVAKKEGNDSKAAAVQRPYDTHLSTAELKKLGVDVSTINFELWW